MTKQEMIARLYQASQLLKEVSAAMAERPDIEEYLKIDVHHAYDITVGTGHHLLAIVTEENER